MANGAIGNTELVIGGGNGCEILDPSKASYVVKTFDSFMSCVKTASPGQSVCIDEGAKIDISNVPKDTVVRPNITIGSVRGAGGLEGGALVYNKLNYGRNYKTCFISSGGLRLVGLRFIGPDPSVGPSAEYAECLTGFRFKGDKNFINNVEAAGWSEAALQVGMDGFAHFKEIWAHNNQRTGYGYAIDVQRGSALIEAIRFLDNRHHVAGGRGLPASNYEVRFCLAGYSTNTQFDMHGENDSVAWGNKTGSGTNAPAGGNVLVHHNTSDQKNQAFVGIRGVPSGMVSCYNNLLANAGADKSVFIQRLENLGLTPYVKMQVYDNTKGAIVPKITATEPSGQPLLVLPSGLTVPIPLPDQPAVVVPSGLTAEQLSNMAAKAAEDPTMWLVAAALFAAAAVVYHSIKE